MVEALQALRGVAKIMAVTIVAEVGSLSRFCNPRQLMGYSGLVSSEYSSGNRIQRGAITKTGNAHLRRVIGGSGLGLPASTLGRRLRCSSASRAWTRKSKTSPGRHNGGCARVIKNWPPEGRTRTRLSPPSAGNCWGSSGRLRCARKRAYAARTA